MGAAGGQGGHGRTPNKEGVAEMADATARGWASRWRRTSVCGAAVIDQG
ncbi:hypothetical protein XCR_2653 [Xanthomonas campestris pv. raphani 756C]|nr:hypothetical protein XCR_2653 [Xanthomonas campestris pv. raphani 756C]